MQVFAAHSGTQNLGSSSPVAAKALDFAFLLGALGLENEDAGASMCTGPLSQTSARPAEDKSPKPRGAVDLDTILSAAHGVVLCQPLDTELPAAALTGNQSQATMQAVRFPVRSVPSLRDSNLLSEGTEHFPAGQSLSVPPDLLSSGAGSSAMARTDLSEPFPNVGAGNTALRAVPFEEDLELCSDVAQGFRVGLSLSGRANLHPDGSKSSAAIESELADTFRAAELGDASSSSPNTEAPVFPLSEQEPNSDPTTELTSVIPGEPPAAPGLIEQRWGTAAPATLSGTRSADVPSPSTVRRASGMADGQAHVRHVGEAAFDIEASADARRLPECFLDQTSAGRRIQTAADTESCGSLANFPPQTMSSSGGLVADATNVSAEKAVIVAGNAVSVSEERPSRKNIEEARLGHSLSEGTATTVPNPPEPINAGPHHKDDVPVVGREGFPETASHVAKPLASADLAEMHVGVRTQSFGSVQVHATHSDGQVDIAVGSERGDLRSALNTELTSPHGSGTQDVRLEQVRVLPHTTSHDSGFSSGMGHQQHSHDQPRWKRWEVPVEPSADGECGLSAESGLSIRV